MVNHSIDLTDDLLAALSRAPNELDQTMRIEVACRLYA